MNSKEIKKNCYEILSNCKQLKKIFFFQADHFSMLPCASYYIEEYFTEVFADDQSYVKRCILLLKIYTKNFFENEEISSEIIHQLEEKQFHFLKGSYDTSPTGPVIQSLQFTYLGG